MQLDKAEELVKQLIESGEVHRDYTRTVELAETYKIFITGENIGKKLIQFVQREDKDLFAQRLRLTKATTPAMAASLRQPFAKVTRTDRIKKEFTVKQEKSKIAVEKMMGTFYGAARKQNRGLDYWIKTRFQELQFSDPNAWVVVEWEAAGLNEVLKPRPFEVSAKEAVNYFAVNDEVKWLLVKQCIHYKGFGRKPNPNAVKAPGYVLPELTEAKKQDGFRYTLYDEDYTLVYEQIDSEYIKASGRKLEAWESIITIGELEYIYAFYEPKLGYAPVLRIGYKRDEATNGRTFVNPWHDALCFFEKSLKTVSELDLTMTLHVFPQKIQYVQACKGPDKNNLCREGKLKDDSECPACKGSGYKLHTTAGDAILLKMPETSQDQIDLDKILVYKAPPIDLVKFQNEYVQQLKQEAHQAVYNSLVFVRKNGSGIEGQTIQTATENENNYQSIYDTLEPYTEKISEVWRDLVTTFAILSGENIEDVKVTHEYNADFKLKTADVLMIERKSATESGAPGFLIESIDDDLANITYVGDPLGMIKYRVRRRFFPFMGSTPEQIAEQIASQYVPEEPKILYLNFNAIFKEIESEVPGFYELTDAVTQSKIVLAKVADYQKRLKDQTPAITLDSFRNSNPFNGSGEGNEGDENPAQDGNNTTNEAAND